MERIKKDNTNEKKDIDERKNIKIQSNKQTVIKKRKKEYINLSSPKEQLI